MERPCFPVAGGLARKCIQEMGCTLRKGLSPMKLDEGSYRHPWGAGEAQRPIVDPYLLGSGKKEGKKKIETKLTLSFS